MGTVGSTPERGVEVPLSLIDQVTDLVKSGFNTVKVWTTNATTKRPRQMMDMGHVAAVMERVAAAGGGAAGDAQGGGGGGDMCRPPPPPGGARPPVPPPAPHKPPQAPSRRPPPPPSA